MSNTEIVESRNGRGLRQVGEQIKEAALSLGAKGANLEAMRARVNALKAVSISLADDDEEIAALAVQERLELERVERECELALERIGEVRMAEIRDAMQTDERARTTLSLVTDWHTHKATATDTTSAETILATGRGVMVVTRLARAHQRAAVKALGRGGQRGTALFEDDPEVITEALTKACRYPSDPATIKRMVAESNAFAAAAYREACSLSGVWATVTAGK